MSGRDGRVTTITLSEVEAIPALRCRRHANRDPASVIYHQRCTLMLSSALEHINECMSHEWLVALSKLQGLVRSCTGVALGNLKQICPSPIFIEGEVRQSEASESTETWQAWPLTEPACTCTPAILTASKTVLCSKLVCTANKAGRCQETRMCMMPLPRCMHRAPEL